MTPYRYDKSELQGEGISITANGYVVTAKVAGAKPKQKRFKFGTSLTKMIEWRDDMRAELKKHGQQPQPVRGTLSADVERWLDSDVRKAMSGYASVRSGLRAWLRVTVKDSAPAQPYAELLRSKFTRDHVLHARDVWTAAAVAPKTINNRVQNLGQLWHDLDGGKKVETPVDGIDDLHVPYVPPKFVTDATIRKVGAALAYRPLTQARYMVLTSTGMRPATFKRALRDDVVLRERGWLLRPTKGGNPVPLDLTPDMLTAIKRYIDLGGFESPDHATWDVSDYGKVLYAHGWPAGVKPYSAKHTVGITLRKGGASFREIADHYGHVDPATSKIYTGVVFTKHSATSRILAQRKLGFGQLVAASRKAKPALRVKDGQLKVRLSRRLTGKVDSRRKTA